MTHSCRNGGKPLECLADLDAIRRRRNASRIASELNDSEQVELTVKLLHQLPIEKRAEVIRRGVITQAGANMKLSFVVKILTLGITVCSLLLGESVHSQTLQGAKSFRSVNYPNRYIRHFNFWVYIDTPQQRNPHIFKDDATYIMVPSLAKRGCVLFQSSNYPTHYLLPVEQGLKIISLDDPNHAGGNKGATFCPVPALINPKKPIPNLYSFESLVKRGYYIRHKNFALVLEKPDGSQLFRKDASFAAVPALNGTR